MDRKTDTHFDVLIIGAGISGIGMACHLARECSGKTYAILERRQSIGGTWDLFRYPGIRSDSDMMSFGYGFRPWTDTRILADGGSIREYVNETAREYGIESHIRFGIKTTRFDWDSKARLWTVTATNEQTGEERIFTCNFLVTATGYYNHDKGYLPEFPGEEDFKGLRIHPQHWPENLDYRGKRVVVIGSGATAVTLIPAMADDTAHITMLQRSPSYVYSLPAIDGMAAALKRVLPESWIYKLARGRNIRVQRGIYKLSRRYPQTARKLLLNGVRKRLGPDFDMKHFTPKYMPWDERLCAVPNGDLFEVIRQGKASVVTDHIERFTENGILLKSGQVLEADIIITATGLDLQMLGGTTLAVDGQERTIGEALTYKGVLVEDLPNFAWLFGYTNISWTLKVDLSADYICRLLNEMDRRGVDVVTPRAPEGERMQENIVDGISAGYIQRAARVMPRQGRTGPWRVLHHLEKDRVMFNQPVEDAALQWTRAV